MEKQNSRINLNGEIVYLAKSDNIYGWRVVHPIKNEDGKINWMNFLFGGKGGLVNLALIMLIMACLLFGINEMFSGCRNVLGNPCVVDTIASCRSFL